MSDDDLIRRGDVAAACQHPCVSCHDAIAALPARGLHDPKGFLQETAHLYDCEISPSRECTCGLSDLRALAPTDAAQAREAALQMSVTVVRQALVDAAFNYKHDKALSSAMFKAETHATNAILALIGERT